MEASYWLAKNVTMYESSSRQPAQIEDLVVKLRGVIKSTTIGDLAYCKEEVKAFYNLLDDCNQIKKDVNELHFRLKSGCKKESRDIFKNKREW